MDQDQNDDRPSNAVYALEGSGVGGQDQDGRGADDTTTMINYLYTTNHRLEADKTRRGAERRFRPTYRTCHIELAHAEWVDLIWVRTNHTE
jgi:hypothetical protein